MNILGRDYDKIFSKKAMAGFMYRRRDLDGHDRRKQHKEFYATY